MNKTIKVIINNLELSMAFYMDYKYIKVAIENYINRNFRINKELLMWIVAYLKVV